MVAELAAFDKWDMPLPADSVDRINGGSGMPGACSALNIRCAICGNTGFQNSKYLPAENFFIEDRGFPFEPQIIWICGRMENLPFHIYIITPKGLLPAAASRNAGRSCPGCFFFSLPYRELAEHPILYTDQHPVKFSGGQYGGGDWRLLKTGQ